MNKTELIEHIAQEAELTKAAATRALDALISGVSMSLKAGDTVSVLGFGTFVTYLKPKDSTCQVPIPPRRSIHPRDTANPGDKNRRHAFRPIKMGLKPKF